MMLAMRHGYTPTLPELQAFAEVAKHGSATRAAVALGLTQSAISRSLASLEARLGVRLFHRLRQRLTLSDAGRVMLVDATRILADLDASAQTVMSFGGHRDVLRIAVLPTLGAAWLVPRLARFGKVAPDVTFDLSATLDSVDFDRDPRDLAILRASLPVKGAEADVLADEALVVVAAPGLVQGPLEDAALARLPLLQQATRPSLWLDWFLDAGLDPITLLRGPRFEQFGMVLAAARAGLGVALVPDLLVQDDLAAVALCLASRRKMQTGTPYVMTYPARSMGVPAFRVFRDWLIADVAASG
jgi:LysR family transcriptional regulator, glycine cleavage system transcriptional activator